MRNITLCVCVEGGGGNMLEFSLGEMRLTGSISVAADNTGMGPRDNHGTAYAWNAFDT